MSSGERLCLSRAREKGNSANEILVRKSERKKLPSLDERIILK
jgi:hypothetical protein